MSNTATSNSASVDSLASRARDLAPSVSAATGIDISASLAPFSEFSEAFSNASAADKGHLARHILDKQADLHLSDSDVNLLQSAASFASGTESAWVSKVKSTADSAFSRHGGIGSVVQRLEDCGDQELLENVRSLVSDALISGFGASLHIDRSLSSNSSYSKPDNTSTSYSRDHSDATRFKADRDSSSSNYSQSSYNSNSSGCSDYTPPTTPKSSDFSNFSNDGSDFCRSDTFAPASATSGLTSAISAY